MSEELKAQDCELEYWNQQAEDYALVQIPCEDLRSIISRAWEAPAFNSTITALEAERNRAQLACQQIAERLSAAEARAEAAEERVRELTIAAQDVLAERARQKSVEGWCSSHDDDYEEGQLARAAASYAISAATPGGVPALSGSMFGCQLFKSARNPNFLWPWEMRFWKPKDPRRDLVRAAALILAEIERLDRAARALKGNTP